MKLRCDLMLVLRRKCGRREFKLTPEDEELLVVAWLVVIVIVVTFALAQIWGEIGSRAMPRARCGQGARWCSWAVPAADASGLVSGSPPRLPPRCPRSRRPSR
jgi:hypothetical protein